MTLSILIGLRWETESYIHNAHPDRLDRLKISYTVRMQDGHLTTTQGDKVSNIYEGITDVHLMSGSPGDITGAGGQQVEVVMDGRAVKGPGMNGLPGISSLTVNGHLVRLYDYGRNLLVAATPRLGGTPYTLEAHRHLTITVLADDSHRVRREASR